MATGIMQIAAKNPPTCNSPWGDLTGAIFVLDDQGPDFSQTSPQLTNVVELKLVGCRNPKYWQQVMIILMPVWYIHEDTNLEAMARVGSRVLGKVHGFQSGW